MKTLKQLREERGAKLEALNALTNAAKAESRNLTEAEGAQFDTLEGEIQTLDAEIRRAEVAEKRAAEAAAASGTPLQGQFSEKEARDFSKFSLVRALQLEARGKKLDGVEAEIHQIAKEEARANGIELMGIGVPSFIGERRGQTVTGQTSAAGDQGGVTVETSLTGFVDQLWSATFLEQVGARRLAGLQGDPEFLVQETKPTIQELTEIEEMDDDEILMSKFKMQPTRRGTAIPFSKQTLLQSSVDVQNLIIDNIRKGLSYKLNAESVLTILAAITSGNGNLLALGTNGAAPTYENMVDLESLIDDADAIQGQLYYLTNTKVKGKLKKTQVFANTNGTPVFQNGQINEYPAVISNIVPKNLTKGTASGTASAIILGNFDDFYVGMWGGADFVVDTTTRAKKGEILVVANMFWQTKVARAKSFAGIKDALTA